MAELELSMAEYTVTEIEVAHICITLTGYLDRNVIATIFTIDGTAEAGIGIRTYMIVW